VSAALGSQRVDLGPEALRDHPDLAEYDGRSVILGIRPEDLESAELATDTPGGARLNGTVELREALGSELMVHFAVEGARPASTDEVKELARDAGTEQLPQSDAHATLVGRFGARARVKQGDRVEVAVDTRALHFFDPETGLGIYDGNPGKGAPS
jgi:multiple sugar transport system ATP-binding protein